jgi:hypothetical protein
MSLLRSAIALAALCLAQVSAHADCMAPLQNKQGDLVQVIATLTTGDPNENGEGEPLFVNSSGGEFASVISNYFVPTPFLFRARMDNIVIRGQILGADGDEDCQITASVNPIQPFTPQQKRQASDLAGQLGMGGLAVAVGGAVVCSVFTAGICMGAVGLLAAGIGGLGVVAGNIGGDPPDTAFTSIFAPAVVTVPALAADASLPANEAQSLNSLNRNHAALIAYGNAAFVSANRAQGAFEAGSTAWADRQVQAAQYYSAKFGSALGTEADLLLSYASALKANGRNVLLSAGDAYQYEQRIAQSGCRASLPWR